MSPLVEMTGPDYLAHGDFSAQFLPEAIRRSGLAIRQ